MNQEQLSAQELVAQKRLVEIEIRRLEAEQRRLAQLDARILPHELKEVPQAKLSFIQKIRKYFDKRRNSVKRYIVRGIRPTGAPSYDPQACTLTSDTINYEVYDKLTRQRGEVIEPELGDTAESLASLMSQQACDHEYARVIVHPIVGPVRRDVLELLRNNPTLYPMYEYREANIVNEDKKDLDSRSIIYKHGGRSHYTKPV